MANRDNKREIPPLVGWTALTVAAEEIGISRQWLFEQVTSADSELRNVRKVPGTGARAACILIRTSEVERFQQARAAATGCPQCQRAERETGARPETCTHMETAVVPVPEADLVEAGL